jgi:hypothetical protein
MAKRIPDKWKNAVIAILEEAPDYKHIQITKRATEEFQALFPFAFTNDLCSAFVQALKTPDLEGKQVFGIDPEGTTYEFIFSYNNENVYGKICLTIDNQLVIIISAHRPLKGLTL